LINDEQKIEVGNQEEVDEETIDLQIVLENLIGFHDYSYFLNLYYNSS
jgi:hypothetical protein